MVISLKTATLGRLLVTAGGLVFRELTRPAFALDARTVRKPVDVYLGAGVGPIYFKRFGEDKPGRFFAEAEPSDGKRPVHSAPSKRPPTSRGTGCADP
jgi:hypothetical protein